MKYRTNDIFVDLLKQVHLASEALVNSGVLPTGVDQSRVLLEPPRDTSHGDLATNAAMVLAKAAGRKPRELAAAIATHLRADPRVAAIEVAGAGFINITLHAEVWIQALRSALLEGPEFGRPTGWVGDRVNVEYVSANPTGPLHVGHCRGAVFGDALANLLVFVGHQVTREFYVNDAGAQVDGLARSVYLRYCEALGAEIGPIPEGLYPGAYLKAVGADLAQAYGHTLTTMPESGWLPIVRAAGIKAMLAQIRSDLTALNVQHDVFFSERSLLEGPQDQVAATIAELEVAGQIYVGRLQPPKGQPTEDWEDRQQTLFRATDFGDDSDRPLMKSDGSYTYFASDIAYHRAKFARGFRTMINVWGADHAGYVKRLKAALTALTAGRADLDVKLVQLVRLFRRGEPVKMSKRAGEFVTLRDVLDEVGRDAVRFMMLFRRNDAVLDFDLAKVIEQSGENPVFYVQYAHARGQSAIRQARGLLPELPLDAADRARVLAQAEIERLNDPAELSLIKQIARYPRLIEASAVAHEPHRIAFYLYELASEFHAQWTRGKDSPHLRFIMTNDPQLTLARLALVQGVVTVLASGLGLLGVAAPDEMR
jgi:arginyl-tRNA synthetase